VPFWDGRSAVYPLVKLRMDFRDPNAIGTFIYHCHILEHEDGGMMGTIRVAPRNESSKTSKTIERPSPALCGQQYLTSKPVRVPVPTNNGRIKPAQGATASQVNRTAAGF
jgi:hypothetical protein